MKMFSFVLALTWMSEPGNTYYHGSAARQCSNSQNPICPKSSSRFVSLSVQQVYHCL